MFVRSSESILFLQNLLHLFQTCSIIFVYICACFKIEKSNEHCPTHYRMKRGDSLGIMTAKEAAEKWGITARRVNEIIRDGRIEGVHKVADIWVMPDDTAKPPDLRKLRYLKTAKKKKKDASKKTKKGEKNTERA